MNGSMETEQLYGELVNLAERLGIAVKEQNLRSTGVRAKSGYCVIKGKPHFILDKHMGAKDKNGILLEFLRTTAHEDVYVLPALRELLGQMK